MACTQSQHWTDISRQDLRTIQWVDLARIRWPKGYPVYDVARIDACRVRLQLQHRSGLSATGCSSSQKVAACVDIVVSLMPRLSLNLCPRCGQETESPALHASSHPLSPADSAAPALLTPESATQSHLLWVLLAGQQAFCAKAEVRISRRVCTPTCPRKNIKVGMAEQYRASARQSSSCLCQQEKVLYMHTDSEISSHPL